MATLKGQETYFSGQLTAEVRISAMAEPESKGESSKDSGGESARPSRRRNGGSGGMGGGMGGGPEGQPGGEERSRPTTQRMEGGGAPPVAIHLRFTNNGTDQLTLDITDFNSPLGNFVVQPSHLVLDPAQSLEVEPMGSRLANDATSGQISLSLRMKGVKETKIITIEAGPVPPVPPAKN